MAPTEEELAKMHWRERYEYEAGQESKALDKLSEHELVERIRQRTRLMRENAFLREEAVGGDMVVAFQRGDIDTADDRLGESVAVLPGVGYDQLWAASLIAALPTSPGGKASLYLAFLALLDPGDEIIVPDPGFPIYASMARFLDLQPVPLLRVTDDRGRYRVTTNSNRRQPVFERPVIETQCRLERADHIADDIFRCVVQKRGKPPALRPYPSFLEIKNTATIR